MAGADKDFEYYRYVPSLPAAAIFSAAFFLSSFVHAYQIARTRTWYFVPLFIGCLMEAIGYIGRIQSHHQAPVYTLSPYIMQALLLLVSPALFAASIYMTLGRLMEVVGGERHSLIPTRWLTKVFVLGDVISFALQGAGGGLMAGRTLKMMEAGQHVVVAGLWVQIVFFSMFVAVAVLFQVRINREPTALSTDPAHRGGLGGWLTLHRALYTSSALILVRGIFRVVEYIQGNAGYLLRYEIWLYVSDSLLMLGVVVLFNVVHPSRAVPGDARRREKELAAEGSSRSNVELSLTGCRRS